MAIPSSGGFAEMWQTAIQNYENVAGKKLADLDLAKLKTVKDLEQAVDDHSSRFDEFREKRRMLFKAMGNALLPVQLVGDLAAGGASMAFPPSSLVFGAVTYLIGAAKKVSKAYDVIQSLMVKLQGYTVRLKVYTQQATSIDLQNKLAQILTTLLDIFAYSRKVIQHGRVITFLRSIVLGDDPEVSRATDRLAELTQSEHLLVGAETHTEVTRQGKAVDELTTMLASTHMGVMKSSLGTEEIIDEIAALRKDQQGSEDPCEYIRRILQPSVAPQDTHDRICRAHVPGTGDWIYDEPLFKAWINKDVPVVFVSGSPGSGKSFLSSTIIASLKERFPAGTQDEARNSVGFFFFKDSDPKMRSFHQALRDTSCQISQDNPVYARHLERTRALTEAMESLHSAWRILYRTFFIDGDNTHSTAFLVLDGLDEAYNKERNDFFSLLQDLMAGERLDSDDRCKCVKEFRRRSYIQSSIQKSSILKRVSKSLRKEVTESLTHNANGMFLWVNLTMRELNRKRRELEIRETLSKAPKGLNEMIRHVLEEISETSSEEDADDLNEVLAWVACAKAPLKLGHLDAILRYKSPNGDALLRLETKLRWDWASLFVLGREDGMTTADMQNINKFGPDTDQNLANDGDDEDGLEDLEMNFVSNPATTEVTFCHASVGDFFRDLTQGKVCSGQGPSVAVDLKSTNLSTFKTILQLCVDKNFREKVTEQTFFKQYAVLHWLEHLQAVSVAETSKQDKSIIGPWLVDFVRNPDVVATWNAFYGYNLWTGDYISACRQWLDDEGLVATLSADNQEWAKSTSSSPAFMFIEYARLVARKWLQGSDWYASGSFWLLYGYRQHLDGVKPQDLNSAIPSAQVIEDTAAWAEFEKTGLWHRRVATTLRELEFYDEAIEHFEKALNLNPTSWRTRSGYGLVYWYQRNTEKALEWFIQEQECIVASPEQESEDSYQAVLGMNYDNIAKCYSKLEQIDNAYEAHLKAWTCSPTLHTALTECLKKLDARGESQAIMDLVNKMNKIVLKNSSNPYIVDYVVYQSHDLDDIFFSSSTRAARHLGEIPYLLEIIQNLVAICWNRRLAITRVVFEMFTADILHDQRVNPERAVNIWERIMKVGTSSKADTLMTTLRDQAAQRLASYYLMRAQDTRGTLECVRYVHSLENLGKSCSRSGVETIKDNTLSALLGLWYQQTGEFEKARACFKVHIKQAIQILSHGDESNDPLGIDSLVIDTRGIGILAGILFCCGETDRALGLYRMVVGFCWRLYMLSRNVNVGGGIANGTEMENKEVAGEDEEAKAEEQNVEGRVAAPADTNKPIGKHGIQHVEEDAIDWFDFTCDGACSKANTFSIGDLVWLCRMCYMSGFCNECKKLIEQDKLPIKKCSPKHTFVRMVLQKSDYKKGYIFKGGEGEEQISLEDLISQLKAEWDIT